VVVKGRDALQNRTLAGRHGDLSTMSSFSDAVELWLSQVDEKVHDGRRSPRTGEAYRQQLRNHVLPGDG
jgi:hypothetical protein